MLRPGREALPGPVEVDETDMGAPEEDVHGRETENKAMIAVAAQARGKGIGRVRLRRVPEVSSDSLLPFVASVVARGSMVRTEARPGYDGRSGMGYQHEVINIKRSGRRAHDVMPRLHRVASLLRRWLLGTHHGGAQERHLDDDLDKFTFRFNRRTSRSRGWLFYRLVQQAVASDPVPLQVLVGGGDRENHNSWGLLERSGYAPARKHPPPWLSLFPRKRPLVRGTCALPARVDVRRVRLIGREAKDLGMEPAEPQESADPLPAREAASTI